MASREKRDWIVEVVFDVGEPLLVEAKAVIHQKVDVGKTAFRPLDWFSSLDKLLPTLALSLIQYLMLRQSVLPLC